MKLKYLARNNGYYVYERRVPKKLLGHPYWNGKEKFIRPLNLQVGSPEEDVMQAWKEANQMFEDAVKLIQDRNQHILSKRDLTNKARKHLKLFGLEEGMASVLGLTSDEKEHTLEYRYETFENNPAFSAASDFDYEEKVLSAKDPHRLPRVGNDIPTDVEIQREAWNLFTADRNIEEPVLFGDCWDIYAEGKQLDMSDSANKKAMNRWRTFLDIVGDEVLSEDTINTGLRNWVNAQNQRTNKTTGNPIKKGTIEREFKIISAVLSYVRREKAPTLRWITPNLKLDRFAESDERLIMPKKSIKGLFDSLEDVSNKSYKPWKEFMLTVMCQSGAIPSELLRLDRANIHLDSEIPYLSLYQQDTKKESRKRVVPVPFRTERLKQLLKEMDEGQETLFPPSVAKKIGNKNKWATSSYNINKQINKWVKRFDENNRGYTSYCLRHSFKHYLHESGAEPMDVLYLAGWLGTDDSMAKQMKAYARSGLEAPEMLFRFQTAVIRAMSFLDTTPNSNVLTFEKQAK